MGWWKRFKERRKERKAKDELERKYQEKIKELKKKDPYTYD